MYSEVFKLHQHTFKALANSRRLEIIHLLRDQQLNVSDIQQMLDLPQANLSQHLQILRDAKLVTATRRGKEIYYQVSDPRLVQACDLVRDMLIDRHRHDQAMTELSLKMKDLIPVVTDPVCKMRLSPKTAGFATIYHHQHYYFCASGCLQKFKHSPDKYITTETASSQVNKYD